MTEMGSKIIEVNARWYLEPISLHTCVPSFPITTWRYVHVDVSMRGRKLERGGTLHSIIAEQRRGQPPRVIVVLKRESHD